MGRATERRTAASSASVRGCSACGSQIAPRGRWGHFSNCRQSGGDSNGIEMRRTLGKLGHELRRSTDCIRCPAP